eukprot:s1332_g18.t1
MMLFLSTKGWLHLALFFAASALGSGHVQVVDGSEHISHASCSGPGRYGWLLKTLSATEAVPPTCSLPFRDGPLGGDSVYELSCVEMRLSDLTYLLRNPSTSFTKLQHKLQKLVILGSRRRFAAELGKLQVTCLEAFLESHDAHDVDLFFQFLRFLNLAT